VHVVQRLDTPDGVKATSLRDPALTRKVSCAVHAGRRRPRRRDQTGHLEIVAAQNRVWQFF